MPLNCRRTLSGPRWRHADVDAAVRRRVARRASRRRSRARRCRASRARRAGRSCCMKRSPAPFEQIAAGAAQAFLEHRAGHARVRAGEQAGRMELHHLHVAQRQAGAQRHRQAVAALVARRRVVLVHRRPAAGREQHRLRLHEHVARRCACRSSARRRSHRRRRLDQLDRAMLLEPLDAARPDLLGEPVDDLDAGQVALVHRAVEGLAGERLLVDRAVGIAVEEAAELVLELADALDRARSPASTRGPGRAATCRLRSCP